MSISGSATAFGSASEVVDLKALQADADLDAPIAELDRDLVGLAPVKQRIREKNRETALELESYVAAKKK